MQIIVLGMHRSGTSLLARVLNLMGCYFGTEDVTLARQPDNPKGFWERTDVITINDYILTAAGGSWWDVESLDFSSIPGDDLAYIREQIGNIVVKMDAHRPWFIKDPRMCLTLKYWLPFFECPIFLYASRSPMQVSRSLYWRNIIPLEYGLLLWEYYICSMLQNLGAYRCHHVDYEQILKAPFETSIRVYKLLLASGISGLRMPNRSEVEAFVDPSLCHYQDEDAAQSLLSVTQRVLVAALREGAAVDVMACKPEILLAMIRQEKNKGDWVERLASSSQTETISKKIEMLEARITDLEACKIDLEDRNIELEFYQRLLSQKWWVRCIVFVNRLLGRSHRLDPRHK